MWRVVSFRGLARVSHSVLGRVRLTSQEDMLRMSWYRERLADYPDKHEHPHGAFTASCARRQGRLVRAGDQHRRPQPWRVGPTGADRPERSRAAEPPRRILIR